MVKLIDNNAKYLDSSTQFSLGTQFLHLIDEYPEVKEQAAPLLNNVLKPAHGKLNVCIKNMRGLSHTEILAELDTFRDNYKSGIRYIAMGYVFSSIASKRDAANLILKLLKLYRFINREEYDKQSGSLINLVGDFRNDEYKGAVEELGLTSWVDDLDDANNKFIEATEARDDKTAVKVSYDAKEVRKEFGDGLTTVCNYLNALALMDNTGKYDEAFNRINVLLARFAGKVHKPNGGDNLPPTTDSGSDNPTNEDDSEGSEGQPESPSNVEETHEEKMAKARPYTQINEGEWKNGDYCWHLLNSVKTYWKLLDATQKTVKPYLSGGEAVWEKLS